MANCWPLIREPATCEGPSSREQGCADSTSIAATRSDQAVEPSPTRASAGPGAPSPIAPVAGLLEPGTPVRLELSPAATCEARVISSANASLTVELLHQPPPGILGEGSVLKIVSPLSWGSYEWLCVESSSFEMRAEIRLLGSPTFVPRRWDSRTAVQLSAHVRLFSDGTLGRPHNFVVTDLSSGGLKLEGRLLLLTGDCVEVTMELPAEEPSSTALVSVLGRVVRVSREIHDCEPDGMQAHIQFIGGQLEAVASLDDFKARQLGSRRSLGGQALATREA
jgi:PilZ domain